MNQKFKTALQTLFFLGIGVALVFYQITKLSQTEKESVMQSIQKADKIWIVFAMCIALFSHFLRAIRWKQLIQSSGEYVGLTNSFYAVMIGYFTNSFLPRVGEVIRCGVLSKKENIKVEKLIGTVVAERIFDLILLLSVILITVIVQYKFIFNFLNEYYFSPLVNGLINNSTTVVIICIAIIVAVFVVKLLFGKFIQRVVKSIDEKFNSIKHNFKDGFTAILKLKNKTLFITYSIGMWVCYFFMSYIIFFALPESKHLGIDAGLSVLASGSLALIVPTPGGLGTYHQLVANTFSLYQIPESIGISLSWLIWTTNFIVILIVGLLSLLLINLTTTNK